MTFMNVGFGTKTWSCYNFLMLAANKKFTTAFLIKFSISAINECCSVGGFYLFGRSGKLFYRVGWVALGKDAADLWWDVNIGGLGGTLVASDCLATGGACAARFGLRLGYVA